jgi:hypothetical protein
VTQGDTLILAQGAPERSIVAAPALFAPGDLVRLSQPGRPTLTRLVAAVDRDADALIWLLPDRRARRGWERPVAGFDPAQPIRVERIVHEIVVKERGRVTAIYADLGLHSASRRFIGDVLALVDFAAGGLEVGLDRLCVALMEERPASVVPAPVATASRSISL